MSTRGTISNPRSGPIALLGGSSEMLFLSCTFGLGGVTLDSIQPAPGGGGGVSSKARGNRNNSNNNSSIIAPGGCFASALEAITRVGAGLREGDLASVYPIHSAKYIVPDGVEVLPASTAATKYVVQSRSRTREHHPGQSSCPRAVNDRIHRSSPSSMWAGGGQ